MNRPGPGPQPLRALPGGVYNNPQPSGNRGPLLGSGRLQNGKLGGNNSGWGFGIPMGSAPGLSTGQSRTNFAQTLGGNQSQASLDLSEFPSLGGASQAQQQNSSSQIWGANPNLRLTQHTPVQRGPTQGSQPNSQPSQLESTPHEEHQGSSQFRGSGDEFRFGGQVGLGQLPGGSQPQTGNIEEFPPLGGANGEIGQDRRAGILQNVDFGNANSPFPNLGQSRNGMSSPSDSQQDRSIASAVGERGVVGGSSSSRSLQDERNGVSRANQGLGNGPFGAPPSSQIPFRSTGFRDPVQQPIGARSQHSQLDSNFGQEVLDQENTQIRHKRLAEMSETERFGLPGLLAMIQTDSPDHSALALGQDLTVLGLDLNRPDNSPLHPTFSSPFADTQRPIVPDFALPPAYTVNNVPPLHSKISSFSADTLLTIFYQMPRDIMQEIAASELYNRDWRWHKELRQWMMKDPELPPPVRISDKQERGWYVFFDVTHWRRERREFELNYDHLDQRHAPQNNQASM